MSQRIHLAWGSVSLLMVGVGFGLGTLEAEPAEVSSAPASPSAKIAPFASPLASAPAEVSSSAPLSTPRVVQTGEARGTKEVQGTPEVAARRAASGHAPPALSERAPAPGVVLGPAPLLLDPDAEALVRILLRLRLEPEEETTPQEEAERHKDFVAGAVRDMAYGLHEEQQARLYVALAVLLPDREYCPSWGSGVPVGLIQARRLNYERNPTPDNLERLVSLLLRGEPESLDKRWIEQLARANPDHPGIQTLFASVAPGRVARVFAEDGLTLAERELLVDVVGREDSAAGARLALELLVESHDVNHLVSALAYDPQGTASFLQQRQGDPLWEELGAMAKLQVAHGETETMGQSEKVVATYWRQLSVERLPDVLGMLADESWTPLENEILEAVLASGNEELISTLPYISPPAIRWKLKARSDRLEGSDPEAEMEVERFLEFLEEAPFTARASLEDFYKVLPQPSSKGAFRLAASFQEKGDVETAKSILERAREGKLTTLARAQLAAGLSLSELDEDEIEPDE